MRSRIFPRASGGCRGFLLARSSRRSSSFLLVPITSLRPRPVFMTALLFGKGAGWGSQRRDGYRVSWLAAAHSPWPATLLGGTMLLFLPAVTAPDALVLRFLPSLAGLVFSIPFAVFTSSPELGDIASARAPSGDFPEEFETPAEISTLLCAGLRRFHDGATFRDRSRRPALAPDLLWKMPRGSAQWMRSINASCGQAILPSRRRRACRRFQVASFRRLGARVVVPRVALVFLVSDSPGIDRLL